MNNYKAYFENIKTKNHWEKTGVKRRAGVVIPLFSIYSDKSYGIGDIYDLKQIIKWCSLTGISLIQLLPLNDVGTDFSPYNSVSSFALDPMYISLKDLKGVNYELFKPKLKELKKKFKNGNLILDYEIKSEKIKLLRDIFAGTYIQGQNKFLKFKKQNKYWLDDYAIFKVLKERNGEPDWENWNDNIRNRHEYELEQINKDNESQIEFHKWIQWQLFEQLSFIKKFANENSVLLIGDIPFLVSKDSADVWAHQDYFRLNLFSGAPPDMYLSLGQRWGMPPYKWENLEADNFSYIKEKIKYAGKFYNFYRIDHFVGVFRIWSIDSSVPDEMGGLQGSFIPQDESVWDMHGRKIIDAMLEIEDIMPCAEDLGTVPDCSYKVLYEYGIPGIDVQRWKRDWNNTYNFINPGDYRINSIATISTHDSSTFAGWWKNEAGTADEELFRRLCNAKNITGEKFLEITDFLFDKSHPSETRLLWKSEIDSIDKLLGILNLSREECYDIILLYLESYNEKKKFLEFSETENDGEVNPEFQKIALEKTLQSNSIFAVNMINEWLSLYDDFLKILSSKNFRINYPGIQNDSNWKMVIPVNVDSLQYLSINKTIRQMIEESGRSC